jgi:hypothetical protein
VTNQTGERGGVESERALGALVAGVRSALTDVERMISAIDAGVYTDGKLDPCFASTIGAHVRHVVDHAKAFADAASTGVADYEHRARGGEVERCKLKAASELQGISARLVELDGMDGRRAISVAVIASPEQPARMVESTFEREAAFVMSHTIHHIAIMRQIVARAGLDQVAGIGLAPGTPRISGEAASEQNACAR